MDICDICEGVGGTHAFSCPKAIEQDREVAAGLRSLRAGAGWQP